MQTVINKGGSNEEYFKNSSYLELAVWRGGGGSGTWCLENNSDDNGNFGHIKVAECEGEICGTLIKSFDSTGASYESENIGKQIIWAMKNKGDGKYGGGKIWSPDRDKVYNSKMVLEGNDQLKISGCVLILCRDGGTWTRID